MYSFSQMVKALVICSFVFLTSCGGISMLNQRSSKDYYSENFLKKINVIKDQFGSGNSEAALVKLRAMNDQELLPAEVAMKRNLIGVILFGKENFEQAIYNFNLALSTSRLDPSLNSQVQLNLASTYFKMGYMEKAMSVLVISDFKNLSENEAIKFHKLKYKTALELGQSGLAMESLVWSIKDKESLTELKNEPLFESLLSDFMGLSNRERLRFIEKFEGEDIFLVGYLAYLEAEKLYYKGKKSEAKELISWMQDNFEKYQELEILAGRFLNRVENFAKMNHFNIGVVLPLSGEKENFGRRALTGIDNAFKQYFKETPSSSYTLFIEDSNGSAAVGAHKVQELVEKHQVSAIVGGLFSDEAFKEYTEARKNGVFFVSLSQIYTPKFNKDHLLVEVPGSVESLVNRLFDTEMLEHFGKRAAIIYPKSSRGEAYVDEFWRKAKEMNVVVNGAYSYDKTATDHRKTVQKLLGLKFKRERQEEFDTFNEIYSLEKNTTIRRIQVLKPQKDFDWVFIPAFPREALQIIPSFSYYDAFKMNLIGDPSWRSKTLSRESYKLGKLSFVGDDITEIPETFSQNFQELYGRRPLLVEIRAYDSLRILHTLLKAGPFKTRDELDDAVRSNTELMGISGKWTLQDGVWMKNLVPLKLHRGKVDGIVLKDNYDEMGNKVEETKK
ncbi:ABC transporter substrate-binding protein [Halobacteriovorax sp. GB3]|uniref:ABC transporter substrate-binding protein n=1 Tax=Halobacteriovorax sp. GB3 TaxID=2719615 RepID=UPI00235ED5D0|nr:ABC transporter substrate-binding protein [Halobacteriovorax sp. GB3]MDD0854461.1 ABC transporter substrate-binding protein [Halobacteriovorax sp. GB3]